MAKKIRLLCLLCAFGFAANAQKVYVNSSTRLFDVAPGTCNTTDVSAICSLIPINTFSICMYYDTIYCITNSGSIFKIDITNPGSCQTIGNVSGNYNSMTVDKFGMIYLAAGANNSLMKFNPQTSTATVVGNLNFTTLGDMIFYKDRLLAAGTNGVNRGIYEIDLNQPGSSTLYMSTASFDFLGLVAYPFTCNQNKIYGITFAPARLVELDLENKVVIGVVCNFPVNLNDAASQVENGTTIGVNIDSIRVLNLCDYSAPARNIQIHAITAMSGGLTYVLDNTVTNTTGIFNNVSIGTHQVSISNSLGCVKDSTFEIKKALSPPVFTVVHPLSCESGNGSITVNASSGFPPVLYSFNGGSYSPNNLYANLGPGNYTVSVKDAAGCQKDTSILITALTPPSFISSITTRPAFCKQKNGAITILINGGGAGILTSLNGSSLQPILEYNGLDSGNYQLTVMRGNCRYDTLVRVNALIQPAPAYTIAVQNQLCKEANGSVEFVFTQNPSPFSIKFDNGSFGTVRKFTGLLPRNYPASIRDTTSGCVWDTVAKVLPYLPEPVTRNVSVTDIDCRQPASGQITIQLQGAQSPYSILYNNQRYNAGSAISPVLPGLNKLSVYNSDNCLVDTFSVNVPITVYPECDKVFVPGIFTPNGDGVNEVFKIVGGLSVTGFGLKIYNRFGEKVFESSNINQGWNGQYNNKAQPSGAYIYSIQYNNSSGKTLRLKGTVILAR